MPGPIAWMARQANYFISLRNLRGCRCELAARIMTQIPLAHLLLACIPPQPSRTRQTLVATRLMKYQALWIL
jgi:hypothetical protein